ncbi:MAG TPA: SseB family protein [Micromonosporaceae bacterium]|jgi:hypothetical protein
MSPELIDGWTPANEADAALLTAARTGDLAQMMGIIATAPLYLPGFDEVPGAGQRMLTMDRDGVPYLLVFTSVQTLQRMMRRDGWRETTLAELVRRWPELTGGHWRLAVNPGTPVLVAVAPADVAGLLPAVDRFDPANGTERLLRDALGAPDGELLMDVLAACRVRVTARAVQVGDEWFVPVFTSAQRCAEFLDRLPVTVDVHELFLVEVLDQWPGPEYWLAVNPGATIGFSLPGEMVPGLLAHARQLGQRLDGRG